MITVAIAEVFYFVEFNPLSDYTGGENGLPGVPTPTFPLGFTTIHFNTDWSLYAFFAFWYFVGIVIALRIVRSPVGVILSAIRDNPLRAAAVGHNIHSYKLTAFVIAAAYAGFAGGLLGVMQGFMPPDAFTFDTSGQLVMQTAIGGAGTLFGPLLGADRMAVSERLLPEHAALWRDLEAGAGRRLRAAGLLPAPRPDRRHQGSFRYCQAARARSGASRKTRFAAAATAERAEAHSSRDGQSGCGAHAGPPPQERKILRPYSRSERSDQTLRRPPRQQRHRFRRQPRRACAASSARTAPAKRRSSRC